MAAYIGRHRGIRRVVSVAFLVFTLMAATLGTRGGALGTQEAKAAFEYYKTINGVAVAKATVCAVNGSGVTVKCVLTNGYGQYYLTVPANNYYYLYVWQKSGCAVYYGSTKWFWVGYNSPNPYAISGRLYPGTFWYWAC